MNINVYNGKRYYTYSGATHSAGIKEGVLTISAITEDGHADGAVIMFAPGEWKRVEFTRE